MSVVLCMCAVCVYSVCAVLCVCTASSCHHTDHLTNLLGSNSLSTQSTVQ